MPACDWERLLEAAELRRRVGAWGATCEDRLKLRARVPSSEQVKAEPVAVVISIVDHRARLACGKGGGDLRLGALLEIAAALLPGAL